MFADTTSTPTATAPTTIPNTPAKTGRRGMEDDWMSDVAKKLAFSYETPSTPTTSTLANMPGRPIKTGWRAMEHVQDSIVVKKIIF
jgi:hypothetical protein